MFNELRYFVLVMIFQIENISSIYLFVGNGIISIVTIAKYVRKSSVTICQL